MLKQAASAAASNSSGLLPVTPSSKREVNETLAFCSTQLSVEAVPVQLRRSPDHVPLAWRRISGISGSFRSKLCDYSMSPLLSGTTNRAVERVGSDGEILGRGGGFVKCG